MKPHAESSEPAKPASPVLPTLLTLGNALCGFAAIACLGVCADPDMPVAMLAAASLIYLAMVFDVFDGLAARAMNQSSQFGAQLDSLSDAISFGIAPAMLTAQFATRGGHSPYLVWPIAAVYVACAILRLARFNAESVRAGRAGHFCGLPSPAAAGTVAAFPLLASGSHLWGGISPTAPMGVIGSWLDTAAQAMPLATLVVAFLMVSRVHYAHIGRHLAAGRRSKWYPVRMAVALVTASVLPQAVAALLFGWYAFVTPFRNRAGS